MVVGGFKDVDVRIDVDSVRVDGRPDEGRHWQWHMGAGFGVSPPALRCAFFEPH